MNLGSTATFFNDYAVIRSFLQTIKTVQAKITLKHASGLLVKKQISERTAPTVNLYDCTIFRSICNGFFDFNARL